MSDINTVKDSSIYVDQGSRSAQDRVDGLIRVGIVKSAYNQTDTGELVYLVEVQSNSKRVNISCKMLRRFGGVFNYEDFINRGYATNDRPDPVAEYAAKAGDIVLVGQINGQNREGVILGGMNHTARKTTIQATDGPQYQSEFNGVQTHINKDGEWTLTFRGQPTNLSSLLSAPSQTLPVPTYDTKVGSSFMQFDKTGSWVISDNATDGIQSIKIDKTNGTITSSSGQVSLKLAKGDQSTTLTCQTTTINSSKAISENTTDYHLIASGTAKFDSPKVAVGHGAIELLDQLTQLIDALGKLIPIAPLGPCTALNATAAWPNVDSIKSKINTIKGSL